MQEMGVELLREKFCCVIFFKYASGMICLHWWLHKSFYFFLTCRSKWQLSASKFKVSLISTVRIAVFLLISESCELLTFMYLATFCILLQLRWVWLSPLVDLTFGCKRTGIYIRTSSLFFFFLFISRIGRWSYCYHKCRSNCWGASFGCLCISHILQEEGRKKIASSI